MLTLKRVYEPADPEDGLRVLIERRWPWRLDKASAAIDRWEKEIAPSCIGGLAGGVLDGSSSAGGMPSNWGSIAKNWSACRLRPQNVR